MAIEDFGGKVNGKPVELLTMDDQNKPDVGLNAARKWLEADKVDAIVGGSNEIQRNILAKQILALPSGRA